MISVFSYKKNKVCGWVFRSAKETLVRLTLFIFWIIQTYATISKEE